MTGSSTKTLTGTNPFVGPHPIETGQRIFGRDREIEELYYLLSAERIVLLHSPSGAGKSSLIQAGLMPRLAQRFDVWGPTRVNLQPPEVNPDAVNRYARSANLGFEAGIPEARQRPKEMLSRMTVSEYVAGRPRKRSVPPNVVLIFDQFEEILTADPLALEAKHEFFDQLGKLLQDPRIWALFALREEYLAPLDPYAEGIPTHMKNRFRLDLLGHKAAAEAIARPVEEGGREFTPEAVEKLVNDLATMQVQRPDGTFERQTGPYVEPLHLQVACRGLWERMPGDRLTIEVDDIESFGDVTKALAEYYAREVGWIVGGDERVERAIREWVGGKLITSDGIRGQVLKGAGQSEGLENGIIGRLVDTHLVRAEQRAGAVWYELAHDRLIEPVRSNNREWFEAHLSKVQKVASVWEAQGRPEGLLLLGADLGEAKGWATANESALTLIERKYLEASTTKQEAIERERRKKQLIQALAVFACIGLLVALFFYRQARKEAANAYDAQRHAEIAKGNAIAAEGKAKDAAEKAIQQETKAREAAALAEEAGQVARIEANERRISQAKAESIAYVANMNLARAEFEADNQDRAWELLDAYLPATAGKQERGEKRSFYWYYLWRQHHRSATLAGSGGYSFTSATFSPDRRVLAIARREAVELWDARSRQKVATLGHGSPLAFSPDGRLLVTADDGKLKLWDVHSKRELATMNGSTGGITSGVFSPDGRMLASATMLGVITLWDVQNRQELAALKGHDGAVTSAVFSRDGRMLVSASQDGTLKLWDVRSRQELAALKGHNGAVKSAVFSADGRTLASVSGDGTVKLWDVQTRQELTSLKGYDRSNALALSPDGRLLATGGFSEGREINYLSIYMPPTHGHAKLWQIPGEREIRSSGTDYYVKGHGRGREVANLKEHGRAITAVTFSSDGRVLATEDGWTVKLWDVQREKEELELGHAPVFSPDGRVLASAGYQNTVTLWDVRSKKELTPLKGQDGGSLRSIAFSPEGRTLAGASEDGTVTLWDVQSRQVLAALKGHGKAVTSVVFSPDGRTLASASEDGTVKLWSVQSRQELAGLKGNGGAVTSAVFSPDGRTLASASDDSTVTLWDVESRQELATLKGHDKKVTSAVFSPDGRTLASASNDRTVKLWDVASRQELETLKGHESEVASLAFSPDGRELASGTMHGVIKLWEVQSRQELATLKSEKEAQIPRLGWAAVKSMTFSPDGRILASTSTWKIELWIGATDDDVVYFSPAQSR